MREQWSAELQGFASVLESDLPGATDCYQLGVGMDLARAFGEQRRTHPFALVGEGAVYDNTPAGGVERQRGRASIESPGRVARPR